MIEKQQVDEKETIPDREAAFVRDRTKRLAERLAERLADRGTPSLMDSLVVWFMLNPLSFPTPPPSKKLLNHQHAEQHQQKLHPDFAVSTGNRLADQLLSRN